MSHCSTAALWGGDNMPSLCADESDYLTDCEEVLADSPPDACTGLQRAPAGLGSDSVSCGGPAP